MSTDTNAITDGVINYDVSKAEAAVAALITARFTAPSDLVVAGIKALAALKGKDPELKIEAMELAASLWQQILSAVYAGRPLPTFGSAYQAKQSTKPETVTVEVETVNPALQALADLLTEGDVDQLLAELTVMFKPLDGLTAEEAAARRKVAALVIAGRNGYELNDEGKLALTDTIRKLRDDLTAAKRETTDQVAAAKRDVARQIADAKREADEAARRDIARLIADAKREADEAARRDIARQLADARREGKEEGTREVADKVATAKREQKAADDAELNKLRGILIRWSKVIDPVEALTGPENADKVAELMELLTAVADGRLTQEGLVLNTDALRDVYTNIVRKDNPVAKRARASLSASTVSRLTELFTPRPAPSGSGS